MRRVLIFKSSGDESSEGRETLKAKARILGYSDPNLLDAAADLWRRQESEAPSCRPGHFRPKGGAFAAPVEESEGHPWEHPVACVPEHSSPCSEA